MAIVPLRECGIREIAAAKVLCMEWYGVKAFEDKWPSFKASHRYDNVNNEIVSHDNRRNPVFLLEESIKKLNAVGIK